MSKSGRECKEKAQREKEEKKITCGARRVGIHQNIGLLIICFDIIWRQTSGGRVPVVLFVLLAVANSTILSKLLRFCQTAKFTYKDKMCEEEGERGGEREKKKRERFIFEACRSFTVIIVLPCTSIRFVQRSNRPSSPT